MTVVPPVTMGRMRLALVQFASALDAAANRDTIDAELSALTADVDLVVLPEAAMHDFGKPTADLAAVAEPLDGPFVGLLATHAKRLGATVVGGMFEATDGLPYNTLVALGPDGELAGTYRKIHLYDSFGYCESDRLRPGDIGPAVIDVAGTTVGLMTCYDLRFPELARLLVDAGAEVLVLPAAWVQGERKLDHWLTLLRARAIENTIPVVACAQCGEHYVGHSLVIDARGSIVGEAGDDPVVLHADLDLADVDAVRKENPSLANRRIRSAP